MTFDTIVSCQTDGYGNRISFQMRILLNVAHMLSAKLLPVAEAGIGLTKENKKRDSQSNPLADESGVYVLCLHVKNGQRAY